MLAFSADHHALAQGHKTKHGTVDLPTSCAPAAQHKTVEARLHYQKGDKEKGLAMMWKVADMEDALDKHPVSPGAILPARELLGDMLLLSRKPVEAEEAFVESLKLSPNRYNSLYGAARSAEMFKDRQKAIRYYDTLPQSAARSEGDRESLTRARVYARKNNKRAG